MTEINFKKLTKKYSDLSQLSGALSSVLPAASIATPSGTGDNNNAPMSPGHIEFERLIHLIEESDSTSVGQIFRLENSVFDHVDKL